MRKHRLFWLHPLVLAPTIALEIGAGLLRVDERLRSVLEPTVGVPLTVSAEGLWLR